MGVVLVLGERGQVAGQLAKIAKQQSRQIVLAGRRVCNLLVDADPTRLLDQFSPEAVINAAAFSAVDAAEDMPQEANRLNGDIPGLFASACAERAVPFVHFSTDYVFSGSKGRPYIEDDAIDPLNIYGASKALGEHAVTAAGGRHAILRTSWLFSETGENFAKTMLRLAEGREEISVVDDQFGTPTYAEDCALAAFACVDRLLLGDQQMTGLFHMAGTEAASWADVAEGVLEGARLRGLPSARIRRIMTSEYPSKTPRPVDTRLDSSRLAAVLGWRARSWKEGVGATLDGVLAAAN